MLKRHHAFAASLVALAAAAGLPTIAEARPCVLGVGSSGGSSNTCIGAGALSRNSAGNFNTAIGAAALSSNTNGFRNTAIGTQALQFNTIGDENTASGLDALYSNTTGDFNTASGTGALYANTTGGNNTASGSSALKRNITGSNNTAIGYFAGQYARGSNNIFLGAFAGNNFVENSSNNIVIGSTGNGGESNTIYIGQPGTHTKTTIAGIRGVNRISAQTVVVDVFGQLGVISSSRRYKDDIQPMGEASSPLMQLRPVTFRYKEADADGSKPLQYGLIAEEVEQAMPGLVIYNKDGTPESVAYQVLPSLLLNEYQKQNRELAAAKAELTSTKAELAETQDRFEAELAALKLAVSRLAAAPSAIKLADSQP
ncbi:MAG: hypothetical protein RJA94_225 [Pseudomonadota bacterium]|jgi:hypothetical protein